MPWIPSQKNIIGLVVILGGFPLFGIAQEVPSSQLDRQLRQDKSAYYTQIEYQRCRSDILELLVKAEPLEKRIKELEELVRQLTDELTTLRSAPHATPAN